MKKKARIGMLFINLLTIEPCDILLPKLNLMKKDIIAMVIMYWKINEAYIEDIKNNITIIPAAFTNDL